MFGVLLMVMFVLLMVFCVVDVGSATPLPLPPLGDCVLVAYLCGRTGPGVAPLDACSLEGAGNAGGTASGVGRLSRRDACSGVAENFTASPTSDHHI